MPEGLTLPDGKPLDVAPAGPAGGNTEFAKALAKPIADIPEPPDAPSKEEKAKRAHRSTTGARGGKPASAPKPAVAEVVKDDYTEDAQGLVSSVWLVLAGLPPTQPYAVTVYGQQDALAAGLASGAKKNRTIRTWLTKGGDSAWMLQLAAAGLSVGIQSFQIMQDPQLRQQCAEATHRQLKEFLVEQGVTLPDGVADEGKPDADPNPG